MIKKEIFMEKRKTLFMVLAVASLVLYPINDLACIILCLTSLLCSTLVLKDRETIVKTLQPTLMVASLYSLRAILAIIVGTITNFAMLKDNYYSTNLYENVTKLNRVMGAIYLILVFIYLVATIICFSIKKDVPLFGYLSKKIAREKTQNQ